MTFELTDDDLYELAYLESFKKRVLSEKHFFDNWESSRALKVVLKTFIEDANAAGITDNQIRCAMERAATLLRWHVGRVVSSDEMTRFKRKLDEYEALVPRLGCNSNHRNQNKRKLEKKDYGAEFAYLVYKGICDLTDPESGLNCATTLQKKIHRASTGKLDLTSFIEYSAKNLAVTGDLLQSAQPQEMESIAEHIIISAINLVQALDLVTRKANYRSVSAPEDRKTFLQRWLNAVNKQTLDLLHQWSFENPVDPISALVKDHGITEPTEVAEYVNNLTTILTKLIEETDQ